MGSRCNPKLAASQNSQLSNRGRTDPLPAAVFGPSRASYRATLPIHLRSSYVEARCFSVGETVARPIHRRDSSDNPRFPRSGRWGTTPATRVVGKDFMHISYTTPDQSKSKTNPGSIRKLLKIWRRKRDSNPRTSFPVNGFQDRRYQPLTHSSGIPIINVRLGHAPAPKHRACR